MAEEVILKLANDITSVVTELGDLRKELAAIKEQNTETNNSLKDSSKGLASMSKGVKGLGLSFKALGVGLYIKAFEMLGELFGSNQVVVDALSTAFNFLSIAFNDFVNFISGSVGPVTDYFTKLFDDPVQLLKDFGQAIIDNIVERFESLIDMAGYLGEALMKLFEGDFSGAMDAAKNAGKELVDTWTGIPDSLDRATDAIMKGASALADYASATFDAAKAQTELSNNARVAEAQNRRLLEQYDRQAELQRQIRDDETKTFTERIAANAKLGEILDDQEKAMLANAALRVQQAAFQHDLDRTNIENQVAYIEALTELDAIQAQVAGLRSEQLMNEISLQRELKQLEIDRQELAAEEAEKVAENYAKIEAALLSQYDKDLQAAYDYYAELISLAEAYGLDTVELREKQAKAVADVEKKYADEIAANAKKTDEAKWNASVQMADASFSLLGQLAEEGSAMAKGIAVAETIWNTSKAIMGMLAAVPAGPWNFATAGVTAAMGALQIANILKTKPTENGGGSAPSFSIPSAGATSTANSLQNSNINQIREISEGRNSQPIKTYVVAGDVTTQQALERRIRENATF